MKINEIHIVKFCAISNLTIKTDSKFNFVCGMNESDKKTIIDFIRIMLYGTMYNYRRIQRSKHLPPDGSDISGSVSFDCNNSSYVLERTFAPRDYTKDTVILKNAITGKTKSIPLDVIPGEEIFKIDRHTFERNSYINESESISMLKTSHTDIMSSIFSNLISTNDENVSSNEIIKTLSEYSDSHENIALTSVIKEKETLIATLKNDLLNAEESEKNKMKLQNKCMELQDKFDSYNAKYEKLKKEIGLQDMLFELDALQNSESNHQNVLEISRQFEQKSTLFNKTRASKNKKEFSECRELFNNYNEIKLERTTLNKRKKAVIKELDHYTPKDNANILDSICDSKHYIEDIEFTTVQLTTELEVKEKKLDKLKDSVLKAEFRLQTAESEYAHFEEISKHKLLLAEEKLHNASSLVHIKPIHTSNNLIYASILLIILSMMLIVALNNMFMLIILLFGIICCIYAISAKIQKEKKMNISRVDENLLRDAEIEMRTIKNTYTSQSDEHKSKISMAKETLSSLKQQKKQLNDEIEKIKLKLSQSGRNLNFYQKQKSLDESKIAPPDPKFFTLKTDIKNIENKISEYDTKIQELSEQIISSLAEITSVKNISEALSYIETTGALEDEVTELNKKLLKYTDKDTKETDAAKAKERISELEILINKMSDGKNISKIDESRLIDLKDAANVLLEKTFTIKNTYVNSITNMKLQYRDSMNIACIENKIFHEERRLNELKNHQLSVNYASDVYKSSLKEMNDKYIPRVIKKASEIFITLTENKFSELSIDSDYKVIVKDKNDKILEFKTLSKAVCDQIYFSLRVAISEMTTKYISIPMIFDDIFIRYDEQRTEQMFNFLAKHSAKSQIIIFSCHNQLEKLNKKPDLPMDSMNIISLRKKQ